jgi:hypothetical protein
MFDIDNDDNILDDTDTESAGTDHSIESDVYDYDTDMPKLIEELNRLDNTPLIPALNTDINDNEDNLPNNDEDDLSHNEHNPKSRHPFIIDWLLVDQAVSFLRLTHPA